MYVTDPQLWWLWQLRSDSARVSYVRFDPATIPDSAVRVTDEEIQRRYRESEKQLGEQPGRAVVSLTWIPRIISAADTAAARERLLTLRKEVVDGAKFEDVARRESSDTVSAAQGGSLGRVTKGRFVSEFEQAAFALKPGELSAPVLSPFGFHLIRVDERKGDTIAVRHILLRIQQSDSAAQRTDRLADELSRLAATSEDPRKFDSAVKKLQLPVSRVTAIEGQPLDLNGRYVPSVSAWAFSGARVGETSDLIDAEEAYYLARVDTLEPGGKATLAASRDGIREELAREKKIDRLVDSARKLSQAVAQGRTLEVAAKALGDSVESSPMFTRAMPVPGLGQLNEVIGAAFGLPVGAVSEPIRTEDAVYVIRVDKRVAADRAAWEKQKQTQREQMMQALRQQRVRDFMIGLRQNAKVEDHRNEIDQRQRAQQG